MGNPHIYPVPVNIFIATRLLTEAEIKALPTTAIDLIPAPGANYRIKPLALTCVGTFASAGYTNINATYASMQLQTGGGLWVSVAVSNDSSVSPVLTALTDFFAIGAGRIMDVPIPFMYTNVDSTFTFQGYVQPNLNTLSSVENSKLQLAVDNNGSGDFTGGNVNNRLRVTVYYTIERCQ